MNSLLESLNGQAATYCYCRCPVAPRRRRLTLGTRRRELPSGRHSTTPLIDLPCQLCPIGYLARRAWANHG